ncbi:putative pectinesterase/pectinesterase inhibitor 17-like [Dorcoceras hygrometricum]|uniref:Putative pectinesterase/pectinesterase inhibitor 17-like n=1 Tax=Dorcoceras hygrometricum TaxID=472368 RepID=A0A2Z6ZXZ2_9LAMI|nr:putative pectinesterase/pectinesterase inhibitor 17-like [Dorcoceras hygrometricum]
MQKQNRLQRSMQRSKSKRQRKSTKRRHMSKTDLSAKSNRSHARAQLQNDGVRHQICLRHQISPRNFTLATRSSNRFAYVIHQTCLRHPQALPDLSPRPKCDHHPATLTSHRRAAYVIRSEFQQNNAFISHVLFDHQISSKRHRFIQISRCFSKC